MPDPDATPRCLRCLRPQALCYCDGLPSVDTRTRLVILQHPHERTHPFGTARLARLCMPNASVHVPTPGFTGTLEQRVEVPEDAAVLFQLARRTRSVEPYSGVDEAVVDAATDLFARAAAAGKPRPGNKTVLNHVRETLGLSLTTRELERVVTAAGAVDPAEERLNRRSEGEFL